MQHDVYDNPGRLNRRIYPFIAVLQADIVGGHSKLVCPLRHPMGIPATRAMPFVTVDDARFLIAIELISSMPTLALGRPIGSVAAFRDEIVYALDWLFTGF